VLCILNIRGLWAHSLYNKYTVALGALCVYKHIGALGTLSVY
jgi:hypothetical protein